jgi:hypothetical protein
MAVEVLADDVVEFVLQLEEFLVFLCFLVEDGYGGDYVAPDFVEFAVFGEVAAYGLADDFAAGGAMVFAEGGVEFFEEFGG